MGYGIVSCFKDSLFALPDIYWVTIWSVDDWSWIVRTMTCFGPSSSKRRIADGKLIQICQRELGLFTSLNASLHVVFEASAWACANSAASVQTPHCDSAFAKSSCQVSSTDSRCQHSCVEGLLGNGLRICLPSVGTTNHTSLSSVATSKKSGCE